MKITISGREYLMQYNMFTALTYQRITDKDPFTEVKTTEDIALLGYAMLLANNDNVPPVDDLLRSLDGLPTLTAFLKATQDETTAFFSKPKA